MQDRELRDTVPACAKALTAQCNEPVTRRLSLSVALCGAATTFSLFPAPFARAHAEVGPEATPVAASPSTTPQTAVVPQFIAREVAQPLPDPVPEPPIAPEHGAPQTSRPVAARNLAALVAATPVPDSLDAQVRCLAGAVYFEARGEPLSGQLAVAAVVINRARSGQFPRSYCGVVHQRAQFSFVRGGRMPEPATSSRSWREAVAIAQIAHGGHWDSPAGDALFFHARHVRPAWAARKATRASISNHIFYR